MMNQESLQNNGQGFEARQITKKFDENFSVEVLKGVDLQVNEGEMVAVVGASGTGKSTLLHILGTLEKPSSGTLFYEGKDVFARKGRDLALFRNKTIGFIFQFHHLLPEFSALENIQMPGFIGGADNRQLLDKSRELLEKVGLADRGDHKVGELSGGEQQRVAIARALVMNPAILLADEPTGNLDPKTGHKVFDLLCELKDNYSLAAVLVTHNYEIAGRLDRCYRLFEGRLTLEAAPFATG